MPQAITEEARAMTVEKLPEFIRKLTEDYQHDYGTICHAIAAAACGAARAVDRSPAGGITGFQAGCIMWEFMQHWNGVKGPARLLDYNDLLFPQYERKFRSISPDTWTDIQEKARQNLEGSAKHAHPDVIAHWETVAAGKVPFGLQIAAD